ncbi:MULTISPECIES: TRM11 family methyltransferase [unclassified Nocardia]|uniref:TRM11 family SAM-dependent methyltransferase n=1 Tax=unclassified Nocardia TaxID=2637762 RepID=UPI001CE47541|nr:MULTISPECIES: DNA methyltransferase [unclassified Nocardia]
MNDNHTPPHPGSETSPLPVSVWATGQRTQPAQRRGRYHPSGTAHPAKMLPALAAHTITHYTRPGDLVFDPMCGIGTTCVEAVYAGRRALGVEFEYRWAEIARTNLEMARQAGYDQDSAVYTGDARAIGSMLPAEYLGAVDLVLTSPPYGDSTHGHVTVAPGDGVHKFDHRYGSTLARGNLANLGLGHLLSGFTRILTATEPYLRPGGHIVITARPWRQHTELIDLPSYLLTCATRAGFVPVERCAALLGRLAADDIIAHTSFFQRDYVIKKRKAGLPAHLIGHEDVIVLKKVAAQPDTGTPTQQRAA